MPNLPNCPKTAVLADFRDYLPSTLDIKQTVSTCPETVENIITLPDCLREHVNNSPLFAETYLKLRHQMRKHI